MKTRPLRRASDSFGDILFDFLSNKVRFSSHSFDDLIRWMEHRLSFHPKWIILKLEMNHCVFNIQHPHTAVMLRETVSVPLCIWAPSSFMPMPNTIFNIQHTHMVLLLQMHLCCVLSFLLMRRLLRLLYLLSGWNMLNKVFSLVGSYCVCVCLSLCWSSYFSTYLMHIFFSIFFFSPFSFTILSEYK